MSPSIRWRIAIPYVLLTAAIMVGLTFYLSNLIQEMYLGSLEEQLLAEASLIGDGLVGSSVWYQPGDRLDRLAHRYADMLDARVTFISPDGTVLGESHEDRLEMDNHLYRPEVQEALTEGQGARVRFSRTMGYEMMYVALPVKSGTRLQGLVRVALPLRRIETNLANLRWVLFLAALVTVAAAALLAVFIAERTARPVRRLTEAVQRVANGDLNARLLPTTRDEVGTLTSAFNQMADQLRQTITTLSEERGRLSGILNNMADGVLITDANGRVSLLNPAAGRILGSDETRAIGRSFAAVTRDHRIIELWRQCRATGEEQIKPIEVGRLGPFLQVAVTPLKDVESGGCLIILQDLTRIRRLETVRRDFISNISHELRTPLASLKALVDTLRDGALDDPPAARRFLDRMETEVDALAQMVRELLELSRIESGQVPFEIVPASVTEIVAPPVDRLRPQAERAGLDLVVESPPDLPQVLADVDRMQQVITNMVHNAIKFTPKGGRIMIQVSFVEQIEGIDVLDQQDAYVTGLAPAILICVEDTGVGISSDDLPRIFERFYKVDRARSGGGTGLGLAIAKHIVLAHDGCIWAESLEGAGASFYVALPVALTSR